METVVLILDSSLYRNLFKNLGMMVDFFCLFLFSLPDAGLGEPGLVSQRRHSCVHQGVGLDKLQGVVREVDGALKGHSWTVTRTRTRSRMEEYGGDADTHRGQKVKDQSITAHTRE